MMLIICKHFVFKSVIMGIVHILRQPSRGGRKGFEIADANVNSDSLLIGILFMSRIDKFFNFIYSLFDSI